MARNEYEREPDMDDTVRALKLFAEQPGEVKFRQEVSRGFEGVNGKLGKIDIRLARIEERQLTRGTIVEMIHTELRVMETKLSTISAIVYGLAGCAGTAIVGMALIRIFK